MIGSAAVLTQFTVHECDGYPHGDTHDIPHPGKGRVSNLTCSRCSEHSGKKWGGGPCTDGMPKNWGHDPRTPLPFSPMTAATGYDVHTGDWLALNDSKLYGPRSTAVSLSLVTTPSTV